MHKYSKKQNISLHLSSLASQLAAILKIQWIELENIGFTVMPNFAVKYINFKPLRNHINSLNRKAIIKFHTKTWKQTKPHFMCTSKKV